MGKKLIEVPQPGGSNSGPEKNILGILGLGKVEKTEKLDFP
jgi:hypothetical protein